MDISLKDLGYILAVARFKSFSQAAEACSVSQPALSKQIKVLERAFGAPLFERTKRKVLLTSFCELFIRQAQIVMDEADRLAEITAQYRSPLGGGFRLGVISSSCAYLLPHFIGDIHSRFQDLQLIIKEGLTDGLIHDLKQGNLDAVIAAPTFDDAQLSSIPLFFEPFLFARRSGALPSKVADRIAVEALDREHLLLLTDGHCLTDQTVNLCHVEDDVPTPIDFRATSLETLLQMTAGGLGNAVIPQLAAESTPLAGLLEFTPFDDDQIGRWMILYYRQSYPWHDNVQLLANFIRSHLPKSIQ